MKNKKFLLTIAMIMSLVMAVSCGDTTTTPGGESDKKPVDKETVDISLGTVADGTDKSVLAIKGTSSGAGANKAEIKLSGTDLSQFLSDSSKGKMRITSIKGQAASVKGGATGSSGAFASPFDAVDSSNVNFGESDLSIFTVGKKNATQDTIEVAVANMATLISKVTTLNGANKYTMLKITINFELEGKTTKQIDIFIGVGRTA